jgi:hypothetical protein
MKNQPRETVAPQNSRIASLVAGSDFHDAWSIESDSADLAALAYFIAAVQRTPKWIDACMALRNRFVALLGLKNLGHLSSLHKEKPASAYHPGERVGIFTLFENNFDEALLGDRDKHLDVVLSVHRTTLEGGNRVIVTVTTVVRTHNALGRLYMLPVKPMHRIIAPAVLRTIGTAANAA